MFSLKMNEQRIQQFISKFNVRKVYLKSIPHLILTSGNFGAVSIMKEVCVIFLFGLFIGTDTKLTPVVQTDGGPIQGQILETEMNSVTYFSFKGIPYAEPAIGFRRFKPPIQIKPWKDVLRTIIEGPNCVQNDFVYENYTGSEDCLYLNVYTPKLKFYKTEEDSLPVMIWIHGGSFRSGYGNSSFYGPDFIIEENVILVTFNYRLGPLGFLNLNHENATGNAGLKDQNLVLRWVKRNIENFGGDPNNITIFGQSAGGVSVDLHGLSKMSSGLFHRSIAMSASPFCYWGFHRADVAVKQGFTLGMKLGKKTSNTEELLKILYSASAVDIVEKATEMGPVLPPFRPSIENDELAKDEEKFLTECLLAKYASGNFNKVPYLTGFTSDETLRFAEIINKIRDLVGSYTNLLKNFLESFPNLLPITTKVYSILASEAEDLFDVVINKVIGVTTDFAFVAGIDLKRKFLNKNSGYPVYYYRFSFDDTPNSLHKNLHNISFNGSAHEDDIGHLFYIKVVNLTVDQNNSTIITRQRIVRMWANFAKYSNPTPINDPLLQGISWPDSGSEKFYLEFDKDLKIRKDPNNILTDVIETVNLGILPIQSGCVDDLVKKISKLIIQDIAKPLISRILKL